MNTPMIVSAEPVRTQAAVAMVLSASAPPPPVFTEAASATAKPTHSIPAALQQEVAKFREELYRRYETAFRTDWDCGGINE